MKFTKFIKENSERIMKEWEKFARTIPAAKDMDRDALRDHIEEILEFITRDMEAYQSKITQCEKSKGLGLKEGGSEDSAAQTHAELRTESKFNALQLASEYRALRASTIKLWIKNREEEEGVDPIDIYDLIRFNESIDQLLAESIERYMKKVDYSRDVFSSILSHDLRILLDSVSMSSQLLLEQRDFSTEKVTLASRIAAHTEAMKTVITDLIELISIKLGKGISITKATMNIEKLGRRITKEFQANHPNHVISFEATGNLEGMWDYVHISQLFANLIENAILQGFTRSPISVTATGSSPDEIIISFHSERPSISEDDLSHIFDSFIDEGEESKSRISRLGLYIAKEIVIAHGGKINVTTKKECTTFTVRLPRMHKPAKPLSVAA